MADAASSTQPHTATYNRSRTRQRIPRAPPTLEVPNIEDNASERKRVLNVLAQRRYRERKKQSRLAKQNQGDGPGLQVSETAAKDAAPPVSGAVLPNEQAADDDLPLIGETRDAGTTAFSLDAAAAWPADLLDGTSMLGFMYGTINPPILDEGLSSDAAMATLPGSPSTVNPASLMSNSASSSSSSSDSPDFPDSYLLPMSDLKVLKGIFRIATRLGCYSVMWDPAANSPFNLGTGTPAELLPETWKPTATQVLMPHHPIMDFLPWPEVRDRIITIFSLPDAARPPAARGPLGLVNFAYDFEDACEGARIWGADPYDASSWEVGQVLFERWWFVFDRNVIEQSNKWRRLRGAAALQTAR